MQSRTRRATQIGATAVLLTATLAACAPEPSLLALGSAADHPPRGEAPRPPPPPESPATTDPPAPPWDLAAQLRRVHSASPRTPSEHLTGQLDGEVLADDAAAAYPALGPLRPIPTGATLVDRLSPRGAADATAYLAMVKRSPGYDPTGGDWEYFILDATGRIEQRGRLPLCARCHTDAPHDHLFGTGR